MAYRRARSEEFFHQVHSFIREVPNRRCLEVGCGHGTLSQVLAEHGFEVVGIDKDISRIDAARASSAGLSLQFLAAGIEEFEAPPESFGLIVLFDVLEHVPDPLSTLKRCSSFLAPTGIMCVEYTPYWSLIGHHLYDFTLLPVQLLPWRWTRWLVERKGPRGIINADEALEQFRELNRLSTARTRRVLRACPELQLLSERRWFRAPGRIQLELRQWAWLGPLCELFTFSHFLVMRKADHGR